MFRLADWLHSACNRSPTLKKSLGYALYTIGFTSGVVGILVVALLSSYNLVPVPVFIWSSGDNLLCGRLIASLFTVLLLLGILHDREALPRFVGILRTTGQAPSDYIALAGEGATLFNMGLIG